MVDVGKILRVDIRDEKDQLLLPNANYDFPAKFFQADEEDLLIVKSFGVLEELPSGTRLLVIVYYATGERVCYPGRVTIATVHQWNVLIGANAHKLKERRRFFKLEVNLPVLVTMVTRDEETTPMDPPLEAVVRDINLGGVYLRTDYELIKGDQLMLIMQLDEKDTINVVAEVLRVQHPPGRSTPPPDGYGCRFLGLTIRQEERMTRYIYRYQRQQKELD